MCLDISDERVKELEDRIRVLTQQIDNAGSYMLGQLSKELTECREQLADIMRRKAA